jgi:glyoxylase-like metal-dependent hydrolase (beta-lactamase superfamily II)
MLRRDIAEGVHLVEDGYVNWFLVEDGTSLTVVDAGTPAGWKLLGEAVGALGRKMSDIEALVLTHAHYDHVGFAEKLRRQLGLPVWLHRDDVPLSRHPALYGSERPPMIYLKDAGLRRVGLDFLKRGAFFARPLKQTLAYEGEGPVDVPGRPTVVFTPGHTRGHCSLHFPERGLVIAGDAIVTFDPYTGASGPRLVAKGATDDTEQALRSLDKIEALDAQVVAVGHGELFTGGAAECARLAREAGND